MQFDLHKSLEILEKTPDTLKSFLLGSSKEWLRNNEGEHTWSPYDILGHLIIGEKTDWMVRAKIILTGSGDKLFVPFDRFAQEREDQDRPLIELLNTFKTLRSENLNELRSLNITTNDLKLTGLHPELGEVTLAQLLSTWTVHDLGHIAQIARVMASQYKNEVGPWINYLSILNK